MRCGQGQLGAEMPDLELELALGGVVAGVDEAGRGPLAGPVVAAAVVLDIRCLPERVLAGLDDSKRLPPKRREALFALIPSCGHFALGIADVAEIDTINILRASLLAMRRAVDNLGLPIDCAIVDGNQEPDLSCAVRCVVGGDGLSLSVAAASVMAKVTRDRMMAEMARRHPEYGWERNAGYATPEHLAALERHGPTPCHRRSFAPVANALNP